MNGLRYRVPLDGKTETVDAMGVSPWSFTMLTRKNILIALLLLTATAVSYGNVTGAGFVWDDKFIVLENPQIRASLASFQVFKQDVINSSFIYSIYYRPVQMLTYALDYRLWGMNPLGFHITGILLHFFNGLLVFYLTLELARKKAPALLASLLFIIHPAYVGVVAYISSRADLLFFLFGFLYMIFYVRYVELKKPIFLAASVFSLALALLSKETALIFPFLLLLMSILVLREKRMTSQVPAFLLCGVYALAHYLFFGGRYHTVIKLAGFEEASAKYFEIVKEFFLLVIFPAALHVRRAGTFLQQADPLVIASLAIIIFLVFYLKGSRRLLVFSLGFFLISLVPFLFVAAGLKVFAEHWLYLPSYGAFLFVSVSLTEVYERRGKPSKYLIAGGVLVIVATLASITIAQTKYWQTSESLSGRVLSFSKEDDSAMFYKAVSSKKGKINQKALDEMDSYVETRPGDAAALYLRGRWQLASGAADEAERDFKTVLAIDPDNFDAYVGMALVELKRGDKTAAINYLEKVLEMSPRHSEALLILGAIYSESGEDEKALEVSKRAYRIKPYDYNALINLGTAYSRMGYLPEAATYYLEAAKLYPERPLAFYNLGEVFLAGGEEKQAKMYLQKAIMCDPGFKKPAELMRKIISEGKSKP